jgi:predicted lysophospholipase L1 biosynthesis ABC-type transport system permease subunit
MATANDPLRFVQSVREIVREADSRIPVTNVVTQAAEIDRTISRELTFAKLCTGFAVLALLMACVGLYRTMSHSVARQVGEIGIRMALGAQQGAVVTGWRGFLLQQLPPEGDNFSCGLQCFRCFCISGQLATVQYAGSQGQYQGLD